MNLWPLWSKDRKWQLQMQVQTTIFQFKWKWPTAFTRGKTCNMLLRLTQKWLMTLTESNSLNTTVCLSVRGTTSGADTDAGLTQIQNSEKSVNGFCGEFCVRKQKNNKLREHRERWEVVDVPDLSFGTEFIRHSRERAQIQRWPQLSWCSLGECSFH